MTARSHIGLLVHSVHCFRAENLSRVYTFVHLRRLARPLQPFCVFPFLQGLPHDAERLRQRLPAQ
ncbi:hypothetical protein PS847_00102 [Pseudomonas fluorescens]|uniref:Uncharacterized protein n=1 Tax=Pseudomonas fluorescens TaxID=294 RepID=A0A5E7GFD3_PSEFL|nr:hypothetical protein PS847_00102 [Pseudomonas fluorescens]